jgi:hypothetical protein
VFRRRNKPTQLKEGPIGSLLSAAPLGSLFETLTNYEIIPHTSQYSSIHFFEEVPPRPSVVERLGGGFLEPPPELSRYDLVFARSGTALWLCRNALPLFTQLESIIASRRQAGTLEPLRLVPLVIDYLRTETSTSSTAEQAAQLSQLMLSVGLGLSPHNADWSVRLKQLALSEAEQPEEVPLSSVIQWAIETEVTANITESVRASSLECALRASPGVTGFDLNRWAYFLLRLQLFHAAVPLARRGSVRGYAHKIMSTMSQAAEIHSVGGFAMNPIAPRRYYY